MAMKLQELHPSIVHLPLGVLPFALVSDALGALTDDEGLLDAGRVGVLGAAAGAWLAGATGLVAQQEVDGDDEAFDLLITHRTLNIAGTAAVSTLAWWRLRERRPSAAYLLAGLGTLLAVGYSAYLGGKMVYTHGLGVEPAGGTREDLPELAPGDLRRAAARLGRDVVKGVGVAARETAEGKLVPALGGNARHRPPARPGDEPPQPTG